MKSKKRQQRRAQDAPLTNKCTLLFNNRKGSCSFWFRSKEDILHIFEQAYLSLRGKAIVSKKPVIYVLAGWELRAPIYPQMFIYIEQEKGQSNCSGHGSH